MNLAGKINQAKLHFFPPEILFRLHTESLPAAQRAFSLGQEVSCRPVGLIIAKCAYWPLVWLTQVSIEITLQAPVDSRVQLQCICLVDSWMAVRAHEDLMLFLRGFDLHRSLLL